jgi:hypothetical protein
MKTLLYLSSGSYEEHYASLPFDALYFVDANKSLEQSFLSAPSNLNFIGEDALHAIDVLKKKCITIDYLVVINEGLFEGGGLYPMFSDFLMGYLHPLLKDEFTLITDLNYYKTSSYKALSKLDWAVEKISELFPGDQNYISPRIFTTYASDKAEPFGQVFKMRKVDCETVLSTKNYRLKIKLIHGSIWTDADDLDYIGLKLSNDGVRLTSSGIRNIQTSSVFFSAKTNVQNLNNKSFEEILRDAESKQAQVLGLTPWGANDYEQVLTLLENHKGTNLKEVRFYHLNNNDFEGIYRSYANRIIEEYPNFFSEIRQSNAYYNQYLSVIKRGRGSLMLKLCTEIKQALKADEDFRFSEIKIESNELRVQSRTKNQFVQGLLQMAMKSNN